MVIISPCGLATTALVANQVSILATYTEKLCSKYCINSSVQPQYSVTYSTGSPTFDGSTVFVPITAVISIITPLANKCSSCTRTQLYTENFDVAFQGQTAIPTTITINSVGRTSKAANVSCCKASALSIYDSLTITIA